MARWELSRRLASRRKELGLDVKAISDHLGFTRNYWSAVENDRTLIAADKLTILLDLLQFEEPDRTELNQLRADARQRGWWDEQPTLGEESRRFWGLEAGASKVRAYEGLLVPGLLQTDDYARCIIESDPANSPVDVDKILAIRRQRQRRLLGMDPISYSALLSEAALMQQVGGPNVQRSQLQHLAEVMDDRAETIEVRILPFATNPGIIANSSTLVLLQFHGNRLPEIAWQESVRTLGIVEYGDEEFRRLDLAWVEGHRRSKDREGSLDLVRQAISKL